MTETSLGSVALGLVLLFGGIAALAIGGALVSTHGIAEGEGEQESTQTPLMEESRQSGSFEVSAMGIFGLVLAAGGVLSALVGVVVTALSLDRGKDREVEARSGGD